MIASEAHAARIALGLSGDALAAELNTTPAVVAAWESGRINVPRHIAVDLTWRVARRERLAALEASGLAECTWVAAFEAEPFPAKRDAQTAQMNRFVDHTQACDVCASRRAFIAERFPPMPPAPQPGWMALVVPIKEWIQRLPAWAQPAATGAALFLGFSLFKLIFLLPTIARAPLSGALTAVEGILASVSIGAIVGFLYGQYRRFRMRPSTRPAA